MVELQSAANGLYRLGFAGDTLNTAWYVRALMQIKNVTVDYLTAIGTDQLSQDMKTFFEANGIGTRFITKIADRTVGLYLITLAGAERSFTYWRSHSAARLLAEDEAHLHASLSSADYIYFSGVTLAILQPDHRKTFLSILNDLKLAGATVVFDTNSRRKLWRSDAEMKESMVEGYKVSTFALPTYDDERAVFGDRNPADCVKRIADYGVQEIVVKDGARPCLVVANGNLISVAPDRVEGVVDTTGAGDSFNAGYIGARLAGKDPMESAEFAHLVASRVICMRGALLDMSGFKDIVLG